MDYPAFIEDQTFLDMHSAAPENEQLKAMLSNLTRVHLLTANKFDSFDALIREYLTSGIEIFKMETGIVSNITENAVYRVCDVVSPLEVLEKGQEFQLEDTYCREVIKSQKVLGFPEVGKLDYMNCHPVYQNLKLEAYLSAPIFVGDNLYGTLNFTSTAAREFGFSKHEHNLILLMANAIGAFILARNREESLVALNNKMKRFVGYVAHDLRNPLGSILSYVTMGEKPGVSEEKLQRLITKIRQPAEQALEFVSTILDNAAISAGKLSLSKEPFLASDLLQEARECVQIFAEQAKIQFDIHCANDLTVNGDQQRLSQTLMNLLINAIKYSPEGSTVKLSAKALNQQVVFEIENPKNLNTAEAARKDIDHFKSIGFGLEIAQEVLLAHNSQLNLEQNDQRFCASFVLASDQPLIH